MRHFLLSKISLQREDIKTTQPGDLFESYDMGPLRAWFCGVRIPAKLAVWFVGRKYVLRTP